MHTDARMGGVVGSTSRTGWSAVNAAGDTTVVVKGSQASLRAILDSASQRQDELSMEQLGRGPHRKPRTFASLYDVVARIMCTRIADSDDQEVEPARPRYVSFDELLNTTHTIEPRPATASDGEAQAAERARCAWMDAVRALRMYEHECVCSGQYCFCYVPQPYLGRNKRGERPVKISPRFARTPLPDWPAESAPSSSAAPSSSGGSARLNATHLQPFLRELSLLCDDDEDEEDDDNGDEEEDEEDDK